MSSDRPVGRDPEALDELSAAELEALVDRVVAERPGGRETLGPILRTMAQRLGHVPWRVQELLADRLRLTPIDIAGVVSFSSCFTSTPRARHRLEICLGTGCAVARANRLLDGARWLLGIEPGGVTPDGELSLDVVRCLGACRLAPAVRLDGLMYGPLTPGGLRHLLEWTVSGVRPGSGATVVPAAAHAGLGSAFELRDPSPPAASNRIALRNVGCAGLDRPGGTIAATAYRGLARARDELGPEGVLAEIKSAGLRERSAGGFPLALKLELVREGPPGERFVVVRGDEAGEGGRIEQALIEGDPHGLIEGAAILALAVGAGAVVISVRADRTVALARLEAAASAAAEHLSRTGPDRVGPVTVEVRASACDAVAGDETAFLAALEGRRGVPSPRPPHPARQGYKRVPTLTVGIETAYHIAPLILLGGERFAALGSPRSTGTKVVWLSGAVRRPGIYEVELGTPIGELIEVFGGGVPPGRTLKAVHCGGRSGGPIPAAELSLPLAYEALSSAGGSLGSGEVVALDRSVCLLELARHFLELAVEESCGKCPPCRVGTAVLVSLVDRVRAGEGQAGDLEELEALARHVQRTSLCVVGQNAPNTLLTVLRTFRGEVEAHLTERRCDAGACVRLISFRIDDSRCDGCGECVPACPVGAIGGVPGQVHRIDAEVCTRCGGCLSVCPVDAIVTG